MPWKECHVMDERLRLVARLLEGEKRLHRAKWRLANARPDPDLRYFSKRTASRSVRNSIDTTTTHGRCNRV